MIGTEKRPCDMFFGMLIRHQQAGTAERNGWLPVGMLASRNLMQSRHLSICRCK